MKELRTVGKAITVEIEVYSECKYTATAEVFENSKRIKYEDVEAWEIITDEDAVEIEADTDMADDFHEYLILHFTNGETSTFRNSYVDMFRVR